jgi:hypothetical protein
MTDKIVVQQEGMQQRLNSLVEKEKEWFIADHNKIVLYARMFPILVLGDHPENEKEENVFSKVVKKISERYHLAIPLKEIARDGNHIHCERVAIQRYPVVIKLDGSGLENEVPREGSIGENILIACDKKCQEKTFLFLKDTPKNVEMVFSISHYCLYFPRTYFCKDDNDMINKSVEIAIRETYRLAYLRVRGEEV